MQTRHRSGRTEAVVTPLSVQDVVMASEVEVRRDLMRLADSGCHSEEDLFEKRNDDLCGTDRRKCFRRASKPSDDGIDAVLGLASLVIESETHKRKRTIAKTASLPAKVKETPRLAAPAKQHKEAPRKQPKPPPPSLPARAKDPRPFTPPTNPLYQAPMFPHQFPLPMFYPPLSLFQYNCFKYPPQGVYPQMVNMYCGAQNRQMADAHTHRIAGRGQNATEITSEDLLLNYQKSKYLHSRGNLADIEHLIVSEFGRDLTAAVSAIKGRKPPADPSRKKFSLELFSLSRRESECDSGYWVPRAISRGKNDSVDAEPQQPDFSQCPMTPTHRHIGASPLLNSAVTFTDSAELSRISTNTTVSLAPSHRQQDHQSVSYTSDTSSTDATPTHRRLIPRNQSHSRVMELVRDIDEKGRKGLLVPISGGQESIVRKKLVTVGKSPQRAKSVRRKIVLPPLAVNGANDILGAYTSLVRDTRKKSVPRLRVIEAK